ncbi:MAG: hypothetical protein GKR88_04570 [Flavobacteriaceae bacterium]|nr:MAG: hypothetical protein GKR88_04570 [Flavobacteriaceae bacterium]
MTATDNTYQFFYSLGDIPEKKGARIKKKCLNGDHLGNVRLSYADTDESGDISQEEIIEENAYYPFDGKHKGYNNVISSNGNSVANRFDFQGKENQQELGLN